MDKQKPCIFGYENLSSMFNFFRKKSRLEILKERYTRLMRRSYEIALRDRKKSERVHSQADKIYKEIQHLKFQYGME